VLNVSAARDWVPVNDALLGFEDGLVREVWLESGMWLSGHDHVAEEGMWRVVVLVQVQTAPIRAALLRFDGVSAASFRQDKDVSPAEAGDLAKAGGANRWFVEFLSCRIEATTCEVEFLDDQWVGRGPFLSNIEPRE
jgi:hypothetical protein